MLDYNTIRRPFIKTTHFDELQKVNKLSINK